MYSANAATLPSLSTKTGRLNFSSNIFLIGKPIHPGIFPLIPPTIVPECTSTCPVTPKPIPFIEIPAPSAFLIILDTHWHIRLTHLAVPNLESVGI